jgi:hypothetical protein
MATPRFTVVFGGGKSYANDWKALRILIHVAAYPLIMREVLIRDTKTGREKTLIVRRDGGRPKIVKDGGRSVLAGLR